jgi:hypothetical protein
VFFLGLAGGCYGLQLPVIQDQGAKVALVVIYTIAAAAALSLNITTR